MQLVTFKTDDGRTHAGVLHGDQVIGLEYPSLLELLRHSDGLEHARAALEQDPQGQNYVYVSDPARPHSLLSALQPVYGEVAEDYPASKIHLLSPIPEPPTLRDFYAFEQHVKAARSGRGLAMIPEWYEIPTFYFSNTSELYTHDSPVPYPVGCEALDFELEIAGVIGREGKDIPPEQASQYIAGYTIMNDWSARDFQRKDMLLNLGPGKGKDFATSLGPCLVTPDELARYRVDEGANERYDMTMLARVNGREISHGNFKDIYYSFPQMIAYASRNARLRIGDVIGSGTVGTGCILELGTHIQPWLQRGDVVELAITGLGVLRNTIV
ncbi:MAG TPA: fumarylacetoacetate hydrolase family protein [Ktedonobacteraceae bacterium]|jgi:fumarylacetoacetate (FAA) hydrolase